MSTYKIAYIGGGSKAWAKELMEDLPLQEHMSGDIYLYDIDYHAAADNSIIGNRYAANVNAQSSWKYHAADSLQNALTGADFVVISILPGTFEEMYSDVHTPEKYGVWQSVGDTAGLGGIIRIMRTVPQYEIIAEAIKEFAPEAYVINFTNPMTVCTRTLYDVFPEIKAFGCCHEVFGTQAFLAKVVEAVTGEKGVKRQDIDIDVYGVNHFTWITRCEYKGTDIFPLYAEYIDRYYNQIKAKAFSPENLGDPDYTQDLVKMDLFRRFGQIAAAGDRHLTEFLSPAWYMSNPEQVSSMHYTLTSVNWRKKRQAEREKWAAELVAGKGTAALKKSNEEFVSLITALAGHGDTKSNVNLPNTMGLDFAPIGAVVELDAVFGKNSIKTCRGVPLNPQVKALVSRIAFNQESAFEAARKRDLHAMYCAFITEPMCGGLSLTQSEELFVRMVKNTAGYLTDWDISGLYHGKLKI